MLSGMVGQFCQTGESMSGMVGQCFHAWCVNVVRYGVSGMVCQVW